MLVAKRKSGDKLSLGDRWERHALAQMRKKEKFFCPECNEEVILKLGSKRIWHFSHQPGSGCESEYERESEYHLAGKLQLYDWLLKQGIDAELERYDPLIRQKPDIVFTWNGEKYALEYQCSPIPEEIFMKRTRTFLENGYVPIWIAAANLIKRAGPHAASLNHFAQLFFRRPGHSWIFSAFCPVTKQFIHLHNPLPISTRKVLAPFDVKPLRMSVIQHLTNPVSKSGPSLRLWRTEIQRFKTRYISYPGSFSNPFLRELYQARLNILTLPPEIGLPVLSSPHIETPPLIWQTYLFLDLFRHMKKGDEIEFETIARAFKKRVSLKHIQLRSLPVNTKSGYVQAVEEYIQHLTIVAIFDRTSPDLFKMVNEIKVPASIFEQTQMEESFYRIHGSALQARL